MTASYAHLPRIDTRSVLTSHTTTITWAAIAHSISWLASLFLCFQADIVPLVSNSKTLPPWVSRILLPFLSAAFHFVSFSKSSVGSTKQLDMSQKLDQLLLEREETISERDRRIKELERRNELYLQLLNKNGIAMPFD